MGALDWTRDLVRDIPVMGKFYGQESSAEQAAKDAANIQSQYGQQALDVQKEMYDQNRADMMPWLESGRRSLNTLESMMGSGEFEMAPEEYSFSPEDYQESPYAKFLQNEGMRGIERSAAARGGLASGNTLAGLMQRSQDIAGRDYAQQRDFGYRNFLDSYGRRAGEKANQYNRLAGMAGTGQTQSQSLGQMGQMWGQQAGQGLTGIGNVKGAGLVGAGNARTNQTNQALNLFGQLGSGYLAGGYLKGGK